MRDIRLASAQFEHRDADKAFNLERISDLSGRAAAGGSELIAFHECAITGYTFLQTLSRNELDALAEPVPEGPSTRKLIELARSLDIGIGAGLIEREPDGSLRNCYVLVDPDGLVARHHKLHPFIHPAIVPGDDFTVFDWRGVRFGILICYDNNLPENARITALQGAAVLLAPHVTGGTPSTMPGRGTIDPAHWRNRDRDPVRLRLEFDGPKGRVWLMRWLPARAWENGMSIVFANNVGVDHDTINPGLSMILDAQGEVLAECRATGDDVCTALLTAETFEGASGRRYLAARRPVLYGRLVEPLPSGHSPSTRPGWQLAHKSGPEAGEAPLAPRASSENQTP